MTSESPDRRTHHWTSRLRRARPPSTGSRERTSHHTSTQETAILITILWTLLAVVSAFNTPKKEDFFRPEFLGPLPSRWAQVTMETIMPWKVLSTQHTRNRLPLQMVEPVFLGHPHFKLPKSKKTPHKVHQGIVFYRLNCLHDTGASLNLITDQFLTITRGTVTPEARPRSIMTVNGANDQLFGYIDLKILNNKDEDITHLVNDTRFYKNLQGSKLGVTGYEPSFIKNFVSKFIQPFCNTKLDPVDLASTDQIHVLFGSGLTPLLPAPSTAPLLDFHNKFGKDLTVFSSKINLHQNLLVGSVPRDSSKNLFVDQVLYVSQSCDDRMQAQLINEALLWELGCNVHSYNSTCPDCQNRNVEKAELSWDALRERLKLIPVGNRLRFEADLSFRHPPEEVFTKENSNHEKAVRSAQLTAKRFLRQEGNGIETLKKIQQKYINSGAYRILTPIETERYLSQPHNFIRSFLVYNEKSASTPVRQVLNASSFDAQAETSLNALLHSVPCRLTDMPTVVFSLRIFEYAISVDVSNAFHNILVNIDQQLFQLMVGFDYDHPDWDQHPLVILCEALVFGMKQSPSLCEAALSYIGHLLEGMARKIMLYARLVDNVVFSARERAAVLELERIIREKLAQYHFPLKPMDTLPKVNPEGFELGENPSQLLGMLWDREADTISPNWRLNLHDKPQGMSQGADLQVSNLSEAKISRKTMTRLLGQLYDPAGIFAGHISITLKDNLRKVCHLFNTTKEEYDQDISAKDEGLKGTILSNIRKLLELNPTTPRCILNKNETLIRVFISSDGSTEGCAAVVHFIIETEQGTLRSQLIRSANKISRATVPSNELGGVFMAVHLAKEILTQTLLFLTPAELRKVSWFLCLDSMSSAWQLIRGTVQLMHQRLLDKIVRELQMVDQGFKSSKDLENKFLHFLWVPSRILPADIASKTQSEFHPPDIWTHGPDLYRSPEQLIMNHRYAHFHNNKFFKDPNFNLGHQASPNPEEGFTPEIQINRDFIHTAHFTRELNKNQALGCPTSTYMVLQTTIPVLWDEAQEEEIKPLSKDFYDSFLEKSNDYYYLLGVLAKVLSYTKYPKKITEKHSDMRWAARAHQTLILSSQVHTSYQVPKSYHTIKINKIVCVVSDFGDYQDVTKGVRTLPFVWDKRLALKMVFSKHVKKICLPREDDQANLTSHYNKVTTQNMLLQSPGPVYIANAQTLVREFIARCPKCNASKLRPFKAPILHYTTLLKQNAVSLFSTISVDVLTLELAGPRANQVKTYHILVVVCCLTECVEFFVAEDMKESTVITKLLILQARFNPVRLIVTDQGTNLRNLNRQGSVRFTEEPLQMFMLLKNAVNASANNQRANPCEVAIKKMKTSMKTLSLLSFKSICKTLRPQCFELLLEHIKGAIESTPYSPSTGTLCPRDMRGSSIVAPIEMLVDPTKAVFLAETRNNMRKAYNAAILDIKKAHQIKNTMYYEPKGSMNLMMSPQKGDIVLVLKPTNLGNPTKMGRVTSVGKTTVGVKFANQRSNTYAMDTVVFMYRAPKDAH